MDFFLLSIITSLPRLYVKLIFFLINHFTPNKATVPLEHRRLQGVKVNEKLENREDWEKSKTKNRNRR